MAAAPASGTQAVVMPKLGLTMVEGMLAEWKVAPGDIVAAGQTLFVVETDKIANEITAQRNGVIEALLAEPGDVLPVGAVLASLRVDGDPAMQAESILALAEPEAKPVRLIATPLARRLAQRAGIALDGVSGSGPRGRIMARDLPEASATPSHQIDAYDPGAAEPEPSIVERPVGAFQRVAARRLTEAKRDIPHFYVFGKADVTALLALREQLNVAGDGPRLTVNHFLLAAVARALAGQPDLNRVWAGDTVQEFRSIDVGLAVEGPKGLVAPVLHDLGALTLDEIAHRALDLVGLARAGKLSQGDLTGGAISISNVGMFGATALVPIINPGQSSILGVGADQPVFWPDAAGQPVLRRELELVLSCDHRVIDGAQAARFLQAICRQLESAPTLLRRPTKD